MDLFAHRLSDLATAMASVAAPEAGGAIDDLATFHIGIEHALGTGQ